MGAEDKFLIGVVGRNQPRKFLPRLFKAAQLFMSEYFICDECGNRSFIEISECSFCGSKIIYRGAPKTDVKFYFHMAIEDIGWDIEELAGRFGLQGSLIYPQGLKIGKGVEGSTLNKLYNAFDVFTLPTGGEGWGLPILEALSCGVPCIVPNYSAHVEFCEGVSDLIKVSEYITESGSNVERSLVDLTHYCMLLDKMYYEDSKVFLSKWQSYYSYHKINTNSILTGSAYRSSLSSVSRDRALKYKWSRVNGEWESLINKILRYDPAKIKNESITCEVI